MIECIPNFSEGRDKKKIQKIVEAVIKSPRINFLDLHSDPDHNRSVITFSGDRQAVIAAAFNLTKEASRLIDINRHEGVHPFIGAVDVIPFVPMGNDSMQHAAYCAVECGKMVWHELKIPVYLYGNARLVPHHSSLADVRRGGYAALKKEIKEEHRRPDIGKPVLHKKAGAIVIGARSFLIAFNMNLRSNNLEAAKEIARAIREKHGGLAGVQALGVMLKSRKIAQVSINITDHKETGLKQVFDAVSEKAKERGIEILESELVGLVPEDAVFDNWQAYLKLSKSSANNILKL